MHHGMKDANGLETLSDDPLQKRESLGISLFGEWTQDQFPFFKIQILIRRKLLIRLLYSGMQPVAQIGNKSFPVGREFNQRAIRLELLCILLPGNQLLAIVSILITALHVEIARFEIPE